MAHADAMDLGSGIGKVLMVGSEDDADLERPHVSKLNESGGTADRGLKLIVRARPALVTSSIDASE